ncbi:hypothetical protein UlMin_012878 [Ulmus minor]
MGGTGFREGDRRTGYINWDFPRMRRSNEARVPRLEPGMPTMTSFENMGFVANMVSLVLYFLEVMYFDLSHAANTLTNLMGAAFLLSLVGGFISDTFLTRFKTCLIFGTLEILALVLITIQAATHKLHPEYCGKSSCVKGGIKFMFYLSLYLLALGSGGVRGALPPLGADQFDRNNPKEEKALATFFNWLILSVTVGAAVGVTAIVYVSVNVGWYWGFFMCTVAAFLGFVVLVIGKPYYRLQTPEDSPILRIIQPNPWNVCTVTQVEEVKIITRMIPILASTVIMNTCLAQLQTFSVSQGNIMNRHLGSIEVPSPSVPVIPLLFMSILLPIYEFFFVPFARKITKHPSGITQLQRVGVGLVLSAVSMAVAGIVEVKRRNQAHKNPLEPISLFWLSFQYGIFGIADMFTLVGLLEFFYKEAPSSMKSLSTSFTWLSLSFGYFLSTAFVDIINAVTKKVTPSKTGWLHGFDLNANNLHLFYWFLAVLSCLNFVVYLYSASWYKYKSEEEKMVIRKSNVDDNITQDSRAMLIGTPTPVSTVQN